MNTGASSHLNDLIHSLSEVLNMCIYLSVSVGDGYSIPVTNSDHSILPTPHRPIHLNNVLITPNIVKNLIYVRQYVHDNNCTIEFDAFGFSIKDFMTDEVFLALRWLLEEIHVTCAHLEKKQTRLRTYTKSLGFMHTVRGDGIAGIKRHRRDLSSNSVRNFATASRRG
ncbi:hypothetical protein Tco_0736078 [Tanacetum coccineum]